MIRMLQAITSTLVIHLLAGAFFFFGIWMGAWTLNELSLGWISSNAGLLIFPGTLAYAAICFGLGRLLMPPKKSLAAFLAAAWPGVLIAICSIIVIVDSFLNPVQSYQDENMLVGWLINLMQTTPLTFFSVSFLGVDTFTNGGIIKLIFYCIATILGALSPAFFIWLGGVRKWNKRHGLKAKC